MQVSNEHIKAIITSKSTNRVLKEALDDPSILQMELETLGESQVDELRDEAWHALINEAPVVESFTAEQDLGEYSIVIAGVTGAYYVHSDARDREGIFSNIEQARHHVLYYYGEFIKR